MTRRRLTVDDLARLKGRRQLTMLRIFTIEEAAAAEEAGIDLASAPPELVTHPRYREVAPSLFTLTGRSHIEAGSADDHLRWAGEMLQAGADCIYCSGSMDRVEHLAKEYIPVVGHVGLVPSRVTWTGGFRAVGRTADEALRVYRECVDLENAGAIAAEIEVVPPEVASEVSKRLKRLSLWSMGSGAGCDAQYLFAMDILGDTSNQSMSGIAHVPRHSKVYRDFAAEHARLQRERVAAFTEYRLDVESGAFPAEEHVVRMKPDEWERFRLALPSE
ncbi:MAG: 3-methyl-2-oxobutanoate hydroxymethyltransferase [Ilumatobacteraceae bacterium]